MKIEVAKLLLANYSALKIKCEPNNQFTVIAILASTVKLPKYYVQYIHI